MGIRRREAGRARARGRPEPRLPGPVSGSGSGLPGGYRGAGSPLQRLRQAVRV